ncbi:hypothetical protein [Lysobacter antibioticus]|uniref:Putative transmembrane protein n=1 Tax=Lysobacter antibioticus TaxID=84531 RepID=A0A0S2FHW6_LYSAN|nr:hypothetical protein [Lysobacter antibioticus]ALN83095.1 putative transmembrane protein [Lysobacter antibioticus]
MVRIARRGRPLFGFATRFAAASLFMLTVVAIAAVHWPQGWMGLAELAQGYTISDSGEAVTSYR